MLNQLIRMHQISRQEFHILMLKMKNFLVSGQKLQHMLTRKQEELD